MFKVIQNFIKTRFAVTAGKVEAAVLLRRRAAVKLELWIFPADLGPDIINFTRVVGPEKIAGV